MSDVETVEGLCSKNPDSQMKFLRDFGSDEFIQSLTNRFKDLHFTEIEDVTVEVLYSTIENPHKIDLTRGTLRNFLYVSVKNKLIDITRARAKKPKLVALNADAKQIRYESDESEISERIVDITNEYCNIPQEVLDDVYRLSQDLQLNADDNEHLRLRLEEKFESKEIALLLEITPNNERVRWNRLTQKISRHLSKYTHILQYAHKNNIKII